MSVVGRPRAVAVAILRVGAGLLFVEHALIFVLLASHGAGALSIDDRIDRQT